MTMTMTAIEPGAIDPRKFLAEGFEVESPGDEEYAAAAADRGPEGPPREHASPPEESAPRRDAIKKQPS